MALWVVVHHRDIAFELLEWGSGNNPVAVLSGNVAKLFDHQIAPKNPAILAGFFGAGVFLPFLCAPGTYPVLGRGESFQGAEEYYSRYREPTWG